MMMMMMMMKKTDGVSTTRSVLVARCRALALVEKCQTGSGKQVVLLVVVVVVLAAVTCKVMLAVLASLQPLLLR